MPFVDQVSFRQIVPVLFLPAGLGLVIQAIAAPSLDQKILSFALFLFCPELARMAWVDLKDVAMTAETIKEDSEDLSLTQSLSRFHRVVVSTIVLELLGFYLALRFAAIGAIVIIFSQLWFNLFAGVQLRIAEPVPIVPFGIGDRSAVLMANAIALLLLCFWPMEPVRTALAIGLLTLITLFLLIKYGFSETAGE